MQIICGQCRTELTVELHPDMTCVQCTNCGHEILLGNSHDDSTAGDKFFVGNDTIPTGGFADKAQRALRERILVTCGKCGAKMRLSRRMIGKKIACKSCSQMLLIPNVEPDEQFGANVPKDIGVFTVADENGDIENGEDSATAGKRKFFTRKDKLPGWLIIMLVISVITVFVLGWMFLSRPSTQKTSGYDDLSVTGAGENPTRYPGDEIFASTTANKGAVFCISKQWNIFAVGGYFPAPLGRMYCMLTVRIKVGDNPVGFNNFGSQVVLSIGQDNYESLGEQLDNPGDRGPVLSRKGMVRLGAGDLREVTFVFDIPAKKAMGTLQIQGMNEVAVSLPDPGKVGGDAVVGDYHEVAPRNIKPLLQDPVMEAIQNTENQKLIVSRQPGGELFVEIPAAGVSGKVYKGEGGVFDVVLHKGRDSLRGNLRVIDDGNLVVFYLRNSPMYQITYRRDGTKPADEKFAPLPGPQGFFD